MNANVVRAALVACVALTCPLTAYSIQLQPPPDAAVLVPGDVAVTATVTSVKGNVEVRAGEAAPWQPATVGLKLDQGAEIRTGLRSAAQFLIGIDETITVDRLGTVTLLQAVQNQGRAKTDLGLKYGRVRYDVEHTDLLHDSKVRSPGSTLAIRGTDVTYEDQAPWVPTAICRNGRAEFRNFRRQFVAFGGAHKASVAADKEGPADQAISNTKADPRGAFAGRTPIEDQQNVRAQGLGGADAYVQRSVQDVLRGFALGPNASVLAIVDLPGPLDFMLEWTSISGRPANLDLVVTDPLGEVLSPTHPVVGNGLSIGQHINGDDTGAPGFGGEGATWNDFFPAGKFTVQAVHQGGDDATIVVRAQQQDANGENIITDLAGSDPNSPVVLKAGETFTATLTPTGSQASKQQQAAARQAERQQQRQARQQQQQQQTRVGKR